MAADTEALAGSAIASSSSDQSLLGVLGGINTVIGVVANWIGVIVPLVQGIQSALSNAPDPIALLSEIQQSIEDILQAVEGLIGETKMLSLNDKLTAARDRLNTLLLEGPKGKDVNEVLFFQTVQDAAYAFADSTYWIRPYLASYTVLGAQSPAEDSYFPNSGYPATQNYEGSAFVYDPQLPLPAFATAISIFTSVAEIFHASDPQSVQPYFTDLATFLENNYETITAGLAMVPVPTAFLLRAMATDILVGELHVSNGESLPYSFFSQQLWHGEIGAVDIYSVFGSAGYATPWPLLYGLVPTTNPGSVISVYPTLADLMNQIQYPLGGTSTFPYAYPWFYIRMRIGNLARFKALYLAKGYDHIWNLIQKMRALSAGSPGTPAFGLPATPAPEVTDGNAHWSLSAIDSLFGGLPVSYENWPTPYRGPNGVQLVSAEEVIQRLLSVIDNSTNHPTDEPPSLASTWPRPLSLRKTLVAAAF